MRSGVILDTGPLVALLNRRDHYHLWAKDCFAETTPPLLTCEAVISEACFLVRSLPRGPQTVVDLIQRGVLGTNFRIDEEASRLATMMERYTSVPMSLADACLVRMSEQQSEGIVLTLDSDFLIYRKHGRQVIPVLMPESTGSRP